MTTIPQRLREIARNGPFDERRSAIFKLADEIAAELEAPATDAVPVVALLTDECESGAIRADRAEGWHTLVHSTDPLIRQRDYLATVAALQARINALESRQVPETSKDVHIVSWPSGALFTAGSLKQAHSYMDGAVPSCAERGVEPPIIVRYVPAEKVPYEPQTDISKDQP